MIYDSRVGFLYLKALSLKDELERDEISKLIDFMKPLMNNATIRNTIYTNNYQFYFNKILTSRGIRIQNDVLTKETIKANGLRILSCLGGIAGTCFMIYNYMSPDSTVKTAALAAADSSNILNRTNTLINYGYGEDESEDMNKETGSLNNRG